MALRIDIQELLNRLEADIGDLGAGQNSDKVLVVDGSDSDTAKLITIANLLALVSGQGNTFSFGAAFPGTPSNGDVFMFDTDATGIDAKDTDGTTDITTADQYDIFKYNGTDWVKEIEFSFPVSLNNFTTITTISHEDLIALVDISNSNSNAKGTVQNILNVQRPVRTKWLTSADFSDGNIADSGSLNWTPQSGVPSGIADGANTACTLAKAKDWPDRLVDIRVQLRDGDASNALVDQIDLPEPGSDFEILLYANQNEYVELTYKLAGSDGITPTLSVEITQTSSNTLSGMFLEVRPVLVGY